MSDSKAIPGLRADSSMSWLTDRAMTRATFIRLMTGATLGATVGSVLSACSSKNGGSASGAPSASVAESLPVAPVSGKVGGELDYLGWQGYDFPKQTQPWLTTENAHLNSAYIATWPDVPPKLRAGQPIDVTNGDTGFTKIFEDLGVLTRMPDPHSLIPNLASVPASFLERFTLEDGSITGVPFTWGTFALVWNAETVEAPLTKWADLLEPQFKGRITFVDDYTYTLNLPSLSRGQRDFAQQTPSQLQESITYLEKFKTQAKTIASSWGDVITLFQNGEIDAVLGGWVALKVFVGQGVKLDVAFPEEGSVSYVSTYWVPGVADNGATAVGWINDVLSPEVQLGVPEAAGDALVRTSLATQLSSEFWRTLYPYNDIDPFIEKNPYYAIPGYKEPSGITTFQDWQNAWNGFKAS